MTCPNCGSAPPPSRGAKPRRFCNDLCSRRWWNAQRSPDAPKRPRKKATPEYRRQYLYGVNGDDLRAMWLMQGGRCDVCQNVIQVASCHVDHDHGTGQVRALLCGGCNVGLGHFKDDPSRLVAAAAYLKRWS